jgi:hypothetical protein
MEYKVGLDSRHYTFATKEDQHGSPAYVPHGGWSETFHHAVEDGQVPQGGKVRTVCGELIDIGNVLNEPFTTFGKIVCQSCSDRLR